VTAGIFENTSVRQSVVMADTREDQIRVGAYVSSVRESGYSLGCVQQPGSNPASEVREGDFSNVW